jgi:hypothetical protein
MDTLDIPQVSVSVASACVRTLLRAQQPVMLWGSPGIGKSEVVAQIAASENRNLIDVRLLLFEPSDIRGIPFLTKNQEGRDTVRWAENSIWPTDPNDTSIIFLDEMTAAPPSVQSAALQLVLNRRLGDYVLPPGVSLLAAGNRVGDKANVYAMPSPLLNRFVHLEIYPTIDDFFEWSIVSGSIHPDILSFLSFSPKHLNQFDPKKNQRAFSTPRSWKFASDILKMSENLTNSALRTLLAGCVGIEAAESFLAHRSTYAHLPTPDDILAARATLCDILPPAQIAIVSGILDRLRTLYGLDIPTVAKETAQKNALTFFVRNNFEPEILRLFATGLNRHKIPILIGPETQQIARIVSAAT